MSPTQAEVSAEYLASAGNPAASQDRYSGKKIQTRPTRRCGQSALRKPPERNPDEALYLQAQIQKTGRSKSSYALYDELRDKSPNSRWTAPARKEQTRLREEFPELFPFHTIESLANDADRLTRERQSSDAENLYKKILNNVPMPTRGCAVLGQIRQPLPFTRNRNEAIPILEQIARDFPDSPKPQGALSNRANLWNRHENSKALGYFKPVIEKYPEQRLRRPCPVCRGRYS